MSEIKYFPQNQRRTWLEESLMEVLELAISKNCFADLTANELCSMQLLIDKAKGFQPWLDLSQFHPVGETTQQAVCPIHGEGCEEHKGGANETTGRDDEA